MKNALMAKWLIVLLSADCPAFACAWKLAPLAFWSVCGVSLGSGALASAGEKGKPGFTPGPVTGYPCRQTIEQVTIAAAPFRSEADTERAFGKLDPNRYGVLPVLVVIQNGGGKALAFDGMEVEFTMADRERVQATPAADVRYLLGPGQPKIYNPPRPGPPVHISRNKNPLNAWEIEGRAFIARMLPPHETASGFFYFRAPYSTGSTLYLRGIREAATGRELFYFEIPLDKPGP